jgi:hypothetical protein
MMVENTCQEAWQRNDANSNESNSVLLRIPLRAAGDLTEIDQVCQKNPIWVFFNLAISGICSYANSHFADTGTQFALMSLHKDDFSAT